MLAGPALYDSISSSNIPHVIAWHVQVRYSAVYSEDTVWLSARSVVDMPGFLFNVNIQVMVHNVSGIHNCLLQGGRSIGR